MSEQAHVILNAVERQSFTRLSSSLYSAMYLVMPLFIPPVDKERAMVAKLFSCPTNATPAGPMMLATTLTLTSPVSMRTKVDMAVKEKTFTMSNLVARRNNWNILLW